MVDTKLLRIGAMTYGPEGVSRDLTLVRERNASFEARARLEHFLLNTLAEAESYGAAWESKSAELERLDDEFLKSGEDLAGLTADVYFAGNAGGGSV